MTINIDQNSYRNKLKEKLSALGLHVFYTRAEGDYLYRESEGAETEVLDIAGSYGVNLLGHFHAELKTLISEFIQRQIPVFAQGAISDKVEALNTKVREMFGDYTPVLTNTGAEAVEAAVKHAFLENGKTRCLAICNAYHGKSLGTLPYSKFHNQAFKKNDLEIDFLDPFNPLTWDVALSNIKNISFAIVEPIRGEGGVIQLPDNFVEWLNLVTGQHDIPIIVDEIQSGLGRTGHLLASEQIGLRRDYICLSKSLGGGLVKIGALLVEDKRFVPEFSILNTSTFADDGLSSVVAKRVLEIILDDNLAHRCAETGGFLKEELLKIQGDFPTVIKEVRGIGLMLGIEFKLQQNSASNLLRVLSETEYFGYALSGYLLQEHNVRVMPTLSSPNTLRIQPSAYITKAELQPFIQGLRLLCDIILKADAGKLMGHLVGQKQQQIKDYSSHHNFKHELPSCKNKVAFIGHFVSAKDIVLWDKSFERWTIVELERLIDITARFLDPVIFDQINVLTSGGERVHLNFIGMVLDSREIEASYRSRDFNWIVDKIQHAADIAEEAGCQALGLGGFTSILTRNGKNLKTRNLKPTTGNSLTVGMGIKAIYKAAEIQDIQIEDATVAIIGAGGNIGSTYAELMAKSAKKLLLISRKHHDPVVAKLKTNLQKFHPALDIEISDQIDRIKISEIIIASSNAGGSIIFPEHLSSTNRIICDLAVPPDVDSSVESAFPALMLIKGGVIRLPSGNDFIIGGMPLPNGHVFACIGETLVMGLDEQKNFSGSVGPISQQGVWKTLSLAEKYGFELGALKMDRSF